MLKSAGKDTAKEKSNVRIPFADFTRRRTRPTRKTRTTRNNVGETKYCLMISDKAIPGKRESIKGLIKT